QIKPVFEPVAEESQEGLAVTLGMQRPSAVSRKRASDVLQLAGEVEEGLRAHEEAPRHSMLPTQGQCSAQSRPVVALAVVMITTAALRIEAHRPAYRLEKGRFARAVLAHQERNGRVECDVEA